MTTPNTPGPQQWGNQQPPYGFSQPNQQQWSQPAAPAPAPSSRTRGGLPWWPTWATIPLLLLTLIGSFLPFLTVKSDTDAMRQSIEDEFGDFGGFDFDLGIDEYILSFEATVNWWGNFAFKSDGVGGLAGQLEEEVMASSETATSAFMLITMTSLILLLYIAALITGLLKMNRVVPIVGLVAAFLQMVAIIIAAMNRAGADDEAGFMGTATLSAGFWLWAFAAVAAIAVYVFALVNSLSGKSGAPSLSQQPQQPVGFQPAQPGHYGQYNQYGQPGQQAQQFPQQPPAQGQPGTFPFQ